MYQQYVAVCTNAQILLNSNVLLYPLMVMYSMYCRVYMADFARVMMTDATMVKLMEGCNFCVPSTDVYMGPSAFWK